MIGFVSISSYALQVSIQMVCKDLEDISSMASYSIARRLHWNLNQKKQQQTKQNKKQKKLTIM